MRGTLVRAAVVVSHDELARGDVDEVRNRDGSCPGAVIHGARVTGGNRQQARGNRGRVPPWPLEPARAPGDACRAMGDVCRIRAATVKDWLPAHRAKGATYCVER